MSDVFSAFRRCVWLGQIHALPDTLCSASLQCLSAVCLVRTRDGVEHVSRQYGLQCLSAVCLVRTFQEPVTLETVLLSSVPFGGVSG